MILKTIIILISALLSLAAWGQSFTYFNKTQGVEGVFSQSYSQILEIDSAYYTFGAYDDTIQQLSTTLTKIDFLGDVLWRRRYFLININAASEEGKTACTNKACKETSTRV